MTRETLHINRLTLPRMNIKKYCPSSSGEKLSADFLTLRATSDSGL